MIKHTLAAALLIATGASAFAADNASEKVKSDNPGVTGPGATTEPTAKPNDSSPAQKQMKDNAGAASPTGTTDEPTAKPADSSVTEKQKKDQQGVN